MPAQPSGAFNPVSIPKRYEERLVPVLFAPWAKILLDTVGVPSGSDVLDVACGTGVVARTAAQRSGPEGRVLATDLSPAMLAHAAARPISPRTARIEYIEGSALELPFAARSFDVVLCQQGLQFFPDRAAAVAEMLRVARPGGSVGAAVWDAAHRLEPFEDYTEALSGIGVQPPFPGAFDHGAFAMTEAELRGLFEDAGFASVQATTAEYELEWPDVEWAVSGILGTPFGPLVEALPPDRRRRLDADLARRLGEPSSGESLRRRSVAVLVRASAPPG